MFCSKCGTQNPDDTRFCVSCGTALGQPAMAAQDAPQSQYGQSYQQQPPYDQAATDALNEKVLAVIAYFIFFVPLLAAPNSKFARYHANQGLILLICCVGVGIASAILGAILSAVIWSAAGLGALAIVSLIFSLVYILLGVLGIMDIVNAAQNKMKPMPLIGRLFTIIK